MPTYALDSVVVYKCEVALALFLASYLFVVAILLAMQGRTVGKVSTTGFDLPADMTSSVHAHHELIARYQEAQGHLAEQNERLSGEVELLWREVGRPGGDHDCERG